MTRQCPASTCSRNLHDHLLMCRPHWYMVDPPLRSAVWGAYQGGAGVGTAALSVAQLDAIQCVNRKLAAARKPEERS